MSSKFPEENSLWYTEEVDLNYFLNFVASRVKIAKKGLKLNNIDSKLYYKLRHNLLKTYVLINMGFENVAEKPFSEYPALNLDSNRTPDFLISLGDVYLLIEFTFCNRYDTVLKTKDTFTKYNTEIKNSSCLIDDYYIFLSLDRDIEDTLTTIYQISSKYNINILDSTREELEDVLNTVKSVTSYLNDFLPELLINNIDKVDVNIPVKTIVSADEAFRPYKNIIGRKAIRSVRIRSLLRRFNKRLIMSLRRKPDWGSYVIIINFVTSQCYIDERQDAASRESLLNMLDLNSERLIDFSEVVGDVYLEKDILAGYDPDLTKEELSRPKDEVLVVDTSAYESIFKRNLHSSDMYTVADSNLSDVSKEVSNLYMDILKTKYNSHKTIEYKSSPFIFYPCDLLNKGPFNVKIKTGNHLTDRLIAAAFSKDVPKKTIIERNIDYDSLDKLNTLVSKSGFELRRKYMNNFNDYSRMRPDKFNALLKLEPGLADIDEFRKLRSKYKGLITEETRTMYQNRLTMNLKINSNWDCEMEHFKQVKNVHKICGELDLESTRYSYHALLNELYEVSTTPTVDNIFSDTEPLGDTLAQNCKDMYTDLNAIQESFKTTRIAHSTLLISQMCYSLMFYSNIKLNKNDFIYDNLGYTDVLLLVKGGKKIRSTRTSRLFRILIPITQTQSNIVNSTSNKIFSYNGQRYLLTPWAMLRIGYLKKGFETYSNFGNYYITNYLESNLSQDSYNKFIGIKTLLMFSQKRKLEVWFSSLRYIYFNSLGTHTDLKSLLKDMPILEYDSLIFLLQRSFATFYESIFTNAKSKLLFDILWLNTTPNFDLMVERFEENLFMARAPFNPVSEHLKNLKSVFDTHKYFMDHVKSTNPLEILRVTDKSNSDNYFPVMDSFDFNFDSKMSYIVGDFAGAYISAATNKSEMTEIFNEILTRSYTEISTSKGMREDSTSQFWGKKGHDVIYGKMTHDVAKVLDNFPSTPNEYHKLIRETEKSFADRINSLKEFQLLFDVKDKEQYKGSREIYVMSENTKLLQNPLEKFFSKLCSHFPNELIHKPSSTRPKFIHSKMFEHKKDKGEIMYCTMDCRKWAPRSNLWKYYFFVQGMAKFLPENFCNYFFNFWSLMFSKRIRIQKHYVDNLMTNAGYSHIMEYLLESSSETYDLVMPYSFMMGIFNFLSSLMHAASQVYFAERIASTINVDCNFVAHSDDSAGILVAKDYKTCLKGFSLYEKFQRSLNHLMSRKKCSLSKRSFEIISIMYCDREFVPMTHKFLSNISFDPKGAGWYDDVSAVTGKVVDLYNNGGSYLQCYGLMLTIVELLRKAYHLPRTKLLSHVPLSLGGIPNYHPVHMILIGTRSHECLLDLIEDDKVRSMRIKNYLTITGDYNPTLGNKPQYVFPYYRQHESAPILTEDQKIKMSAISSLPFKSTLISLMKHTNKLSDKQYVFSLLNVDTNQIMLSTLFYRCSIVLSENKAVTLRNVVDSYITLYKTDYNDESLDYVYPLGNYMSYFRQTESLKILYDKVKVDRVKVCKPMIYNTLENFSLRISQENMMVLSAIEKWPDIKNTFNDPEKYEGLKNYILNSLPGSLDEKLNYIKNFDPSEKEDRVRSGYLFIPSQIKIDTPSRFFTYSLLYTTRRYKISSQKPQLFTPSEFTLESRGFEHLKHEYLVLKLLKKYLKEETKINVLLKSLEECDICRKNNTSIQHALEYKSYFDNREFASFIPQLPFCDYTTAQIRGKNVWYSSSDFKIYTQFGTVESLTVDGQVWTKWIVEDADYLQALWGLYRIFCISRGINYERPVAQDTGLSVPRVAFTDFDTPYMPNTYGKGLVLAHSQVFRKSSVMPKVYRRGNKFLLNDRIVDFELYAIYDISQSLFNRHNLNSIRDLIYTLDIEVDRDVLLKNFDNSKIYKILLTDESHFSNQENKYKKTDMLGGPCSFTRALAIADERGITRYRSSYNPSFITKGAIEFDTVEGVPVLDMFSKVNYTRMRPIEKISFEKAISGEDLTAVDQQNLINIKNKMGLEALGSALILHRHIFRNMLAGSVSKVSKDALEQLVICCLTAIHDCMESYPRDKVKNEYPGSSKSFWIILKTIASREFHRREMSLHLVRGLLRAKADNSYKFWNIISNDVLLSSMFINNKNFLNLFSMFYGIVGSLRKTFNSLIYDKDGNPRFRRIALSKVLEEGDYVEQECIVNTILKEGDPLILDDEMLDVVTGGDDLDEDDYDEITEREYDEDNDEYKATVFTTEELKFVMYETAISDYSQITLLCATEYLCFPWLGKGDYEVVSVEGITYYQSVFPGKSVYHDIDINKARKVETKEFVELTKNYDVEISESRLKDKKRLLAYEEELKTLETTIDLRVKEIEKFEIQMEHEEQKEGDNTLKMEISKLRSEMLALKSKRSEVYSEYHDLKTQINTRRIREEAESQILKPKVLKSREEAVEALKMLNVFNPRLVNYLFPENRSLMDALLDNIMKIFETSNFQKNINDIIRKRIYGRHHLPGFQGLLEDSKTLAEMKALFGDNCFTLLQGGVRVTKATYNQYRKFITRNYNLCNVEDRAVLLFIMAVLMDTVTDDSSDNWFTDTINNIFDSIDDRINPDEETIIMPVNPRPNIIEYRELDLFD